jgi:predicted RNase H-like nuclease
MGTEGPTSVGVDLAWGETARTGLCVAADGRVISSGTAQSNDEIVAWIEPWLGPGTVVAVDAPLIVPNATGQRVPERLVSQLFSAAGASAHSANRSIPAFADGGRGARLATRLGLATDPAASLPAMIEVYPHPALVALFGLQRSLAYKAKSGRSVSDRRVVFEVLFGHLESLGSADPPMDVAGAPRWSAIRAEVDHAISHSQLDALEDEVDAYVCAYVGLHRLRWGDERSAVLGNAVDGYIVTPLDPERMARFRAIGSSPAKDRSVASSRPSYRGDEDRVLTAFRSWLEADGWTIVPTSSFADMVAERGDERLVAEAKGFTGSSVGLDVDTMYGQLLRRMSVERATSWGIVVPDKAVKAALRVSGDVRRSLGITVFEVRGEDVVSHI